MLPQCSVPVFAPMSPQCCLNAVCLSLPQCRLNAASMQCACLCPNVASMLPRWSVTVFAGGCDVLRSRDAASAPQ
eukprot:1138195-Pelagomonas_calceolata.AAC.1